MKKKTFTRRQFMVTSGAASTTMIAAPFVRTAHAAGKLSIGLWDHWVPDANNTSRALIEDWASREKVNVQIDYITSQGNKLLLTESAGADLKHISKVFGGCNQRGASHEPRNHRAPLA